MADLCMAKRSSSENDSRSHVHRCDYRPESLMVTLDGKRPNSGHSAGPLEKETLDSAASQPVKVGRGQTLT